MAATLKSSVRVFGGTLQRLTHASSACKCDMTFAVYLPPQADTTPVPVMYWLSGLTIGLAVMMTLPLGPASGR